MKFESISQDKFAQFEDQKAKNLNAILGGAVDTSRPGESHDTGHKTKGKWELDNVVTTNNGLPASGDTDPD